VGLPQLKDMVDGVLAQHDGQDVWRGELLKDATVHAAPKPPIKGLDTKLKGRATVDDLAEGRGSCRVTDDMPLAAACGERTKAHDDLLAEQLVEHVRLMDASGRRGKLEPCRRRHSRLVVGAMDAERRVYSARRIDRDEVCGIRRHALSQSAISTVL